MASDDLVRAIALALTERVGWTLIQRLLEHFGTLEAILAADAGELQGVRGIGKQIAANIRGINLDKTSADLRRFDERGIRALSWLDADYPASLSTLDDKPLAIFWRGTHFPGEGERTIAIVGTREPAEKSRRLAYRWAAAFARRGWIVVSGLARGIDTAAHQGALDAGGQTLAILGCGVNVIYPPENDDLARQIAANGGLMSEVHPDTSVSPAALRLRNRLITVLSRATIVIEAGETSGALHAARYNLLQGHPLFALPNSAGNIALLDRGEARALPEHPSAIDGLIEQIERFSRP